jgi:integrase/recombinase XerC/integrase/recombinase XerD
MTGGSKMIEKFLATLEKEGKSDLTVRQYRASLEKFDRWLILDGGYGRGAGGSPGRGKGSKICGQFLKNGMGSEDPPTDQRSDRGSTVSDRVSNRGSSERCPDTITHATQLDIANFKRWASQNYKPRTVQLNLIHLSVFFKYLVRQGIIPDNPCQNVAPVTVQQDAPKWLERNDQNSLIRAVRKYGDIRELSIITLLLHTGLRVSELCDLRIMDISLQDRKGQLTVQSGKGGKYREVPLNLDARKAIEDYRKSIVDVEGKDLQMNGEAYLFRTQRSDQMTTRAVQHILTKYAKLTGLDVTPHVLRHTFGHELAVRKVPLDVIARLMGHMKRDGSPKLDMVIRYTIPGNGDLERAVEELSWR